MSQKLVEAATDGDGLNEECTKSTVVTELAELKRSFQILLAARVPPASSISFHCPPQTSISA
jgi:hypothetical protein